MPFWNNAKPIETEYNGYRFRSRLEARWAVFFDEARMPYFYEYEGFDLDGLWYLPDFWQPEMKIWIEIKGQPPSKEELLKARLLCQKTGKSVYVFVGEPSSPLHTIYGLNSKSELVTHVSNDPKGPIGWVLENGYITICRWKNCRGDEVNHPLLLNAYNEARYARFER